MATKSPPVRNRASQKSALFERAVRAHLAGDLAAAEAEYRRLLATTPNHAEALNNLGAILASAGRRDEAGDLLRRAIEQDPRYGEALNNLGLLSIEIGQLAAAFDYFSRATEVDPRKADWLNNLGNAAVELQQFDAGLAAYDGAIAASPADARYWNNRGLALRALRRPADAIASFERALAIDPRHVNALGNKAIVHLDEKDFAPAIAAYEQAVAIEPNNAALVANFATVYETMCDHDRMRDLARRAIEIDPSYPEGYNLLANYELEAGRYDAAESLYEKTLSIDPTNRNASWNLAIIWLLKGDYERGWRQFEARRRLQGVIHDVGTYPGPEWDGSDLNGRTILLVTEQGIGDGVQFIRYARELKRRGAGRVIVECPFPIAPLLNGVPGVDLAFARGTAIPPYDTWAQLMSLPGLMRTTVDTIPADVPYIVAEPRPVAAVVSAPAGVVKVGIVWSGNPLHRRDVLRSAELSRFAPLLDIPNTRFFSIQKGEEGERQLRDFGDARITDLAPHLNDLRDTAAVIDQLDLVIAVDTSMAHLAGAMGKPTWVLLPHVPDFRWMIERSDSPWYPTMRLFRQPAPRRWDEVFASVEHHLRQLAEGTPASNSSGTDMTANAEPLVASLDAATQYPDGRPRFDLWIPLPRLVDPAWFAQYEAELVGAGYQRTLREFWDEASRVVEGVVDTTPGIGLMLLSLQTAQRPVGRIVVIEPNAGDADRLRALVVSRPRGDTVTVVANAQEAVAALVLAGCRSIGVHADDPHALTAFAGAWDSSGIRPHVDIVTCAAPGDRDLPAWAGLLPVAVSLQEGEVQLDPIDESTPAGDVAWISSSALDALGAPDESAAAAPRAPSPVTIDFRPQAAHFTSGAGHPVPVAPAPSTVRELGIDWQLRGDTGWGVYGTNLALELMRRDDIRPGLFNVEEPALTPVAAWRLREVIASTAARRRAAADPTAPMPAFNGTMLRGLGNNFSTSALWERVHARRNIGMIFFEDPAFDAQAMERARSLDHIVAGSAWNGDVMRAAGFSHVTTVPQGIDPTVFHPAPRSGQLRDRFVIFSGGKLEYRKGQDIVVAAFRRFRERHPDALLVTAWHNAWPHLISDLELAGHVKGTPRFNSEGLLITEWLAQNGIQADAVLDVGHTPNALMGAVVREADVALFTNRCEGGTNLVAMECMAAGVPTIVSANTGHLDLVNAGGCVALSRQAAVPAPTRFYRSTEGWGESDVDEIVDMLERLYSDRQAAQQVAIRGAEVMKDWTWPKQVDRLLQVLQPFIEG